jgi:hypothetical protein
MGQETGKKEIEELWKNHSRGPNRYNSFTALPEYTGVIFGDTHVDGIGKEVRIGFPSLWILNQDKDSLHRDQVPRLFLLYFPPLLKTDINPGVP